MSRRRSAERAYDCYAPIYDEWNSANNYESWLGSYLLPILAQHALRHGTVLDIGCGTGRAFEPLLRRGWKVVGCDISAGMLAEAKEKYGDLVPTFKADARELSGGLATRYASSPSGFELILMLNDVVNYFTGDVELEQALAGVRRNLRPAGGLLLFDANTLRLFDADYLSDAKEERGDGWEWRGLSQRLTAGAVFRGRISGEGVESHIHTQRHWTPAQVESALERTGLSLLGSYGQYEGQGRLVLTEPPDENRDEKIIYVASTQ